MKASNTLALVLAGLTTWSVSSLQAAEGVGSQANVQPRTSDAAAAPPVLQAGELTARFSAEHGSLQSLAVRGHQLLAAPGQLLIELDGKEKEKV